MPFALITGASKGIGKSIARILASRGYDLLLVARSEELLKTVSEEISTGSVVTCHYLTIDLAAEQAADMVYAWCQNNHFPVSILVNNAGYGLSGSFGKIFSGGPFRNVAPEYYYAG